MAEFFIEGLVHRLLDLNDATARGLRQRATFYCVPNMNPGRVNYCLVYLYLNNEHLTRSVFKNLLQFESSRNAHTRFRE